MGILENFMKVLDPFSWENIHTHIDIVFVYYLGGLQGKSAFAWQGWIRSYGLFLERELQAAFLPVASAKWDWSKQFSPQGQINCVKP